MDGDFDYTQRGIINTTANSYNLTVGGDFSYDDSASDFTWAIVIHLQFLATLILLQLILLIAELSLLLIAEIYR